MDDYDILIDADGNVSYVYADDLRGLEALGVAATRRVSQVEPHPDGGWYADMAPVDGPLLGARVPFATRQAALDAERDWLRVWMRKNGAAASVRPA